MTQTSLKKNLLLLRICIITTALVVASLFLFSFKLAETRAEDFWKQLGLSQAQGAEKIKTSFMHGYLDTWGIRNLKSVAAGNRATLAKELLAFSKNYMNSAAVKTAFDKERLAAKPQAPQLTVVSKEVIRKEKIDELKKAISDAENLVKQFPDQEKSVRKTVASFQKSIREYERADNEIIAMFYQSSVDENKAREEDYKKSMKAWEENYPANYKQKIKKQLDKYLALGGTVDFEAGLKERYGKMVFVKPEYESKSPEWKAIYRAGKDVYDVTKPFAEKWLQELQ